jgi:hypothetical protein
MPGAKASGELPMHNRIISGHVHPVAYVLLLAPVSDDHATVRLPRSSFRPGHMCEVVPVCTPLPDLVTLLFLPCSCTDG